jgi:hypothetical protein
MWIGASGRSWVSLHGGEFLWGAIIGIAATLVIGLAIYWAQRQPKRLAWSLTADTALLAAPHAPEAEALVVMYGGEVVTFPRSIALRIWNYGKVEISADDGDYEIPLTVSISGPAVKGVSIADAKTAWIRDNTTLNTTSNKRETSVRPRALHRGDWIDLRAVVDGTEELIVEVDTQVKHQTHKIKFIEADLVTGQPQTLRYFAEQALRSALKLLTPGPAAIAINLGRSIGPK